MPQPKRQHYVPALSLKHFAGPNPAGQVWTYDAEAGRCWSATPENTGLESHFYSVQAEDGSMDTRIEEHLSKVETSVAPVYAQLVAGSVPPRNQPRADFATFLALMHVRTPAMRRMGAEVIGRGLQVMCYAYGKNERAFDDLLRSVEADGDEPPLTPSQKEQLRRDFIDPSNYTMQIDKERTLMVLGAADNLAPILMGMNWSVIEPAHGFFITTDNPVLREVDPKSRHPFYGDHGFLNKTAEVSFPLSPHRLLMMTHRDLPAVARVPREYVERFNRGLAAHSERYLYAHIEHKRLSALAAEFRHSRPGMTTKGFGPKNFAKVEVARRL